MDKLERQIQNLREELDGVEQPDREAIWAGMQARMKPEARVVSFYQRPFVAMVAASIAVVLIAGAGWFAHSIFGGSETADELAYAPEFKVMEEHYEQLIADKKQALRLENIDKDAYAEVLKELEEVEQMQQQYKEELSSLPKDERSVQTLLRMYEQKIRILEILSKEIQIKKNEKERNSEQSI